MKFLAILLSVILIFNFVISEPILWGTLDKYDRLLERYVVSKKGKWFVTHDITVTYPPKNQTSFETISAIRLWDLGGRTNFGYAQLLSGGPGFKNATIELISQRGGNLFFAVEYYGQ